MKTLASYLPSLEIKVLKAEKIAKKEPFTLFNVEPNWEALKSKRCPVCGSLLKIVRNNSKIVICRGLRHGDRKPFVITAKAYYSLIK